MNPKTVKSLSSSLTKESQKNGLNLLKWPSQKSDRRQKSKTGELVEVYPANRRADTSFLDLSEPKIKARLVTRGKPGVRDSEVNQEKIQLVEWANQLVGLCKRKISAGGKRWR